MNTPRKKLIEVALPLEAINVESAREKSIRHGHPSTLHLWWARRPLAACRAVLFASLVDDPSSRPDLYPTEEAQNLRREELFAIIRELVKWDNVSGGKNATDPDIVAKAHKEIIDATGGNPPPVLDPFCGGGSIPLEAQRLGLEAHGSDLNPVAVLITKALIEIPPKFAGCPPVHPEAGQQQMTRTWKGAQGLAEDVRYYGKWMRDEAFKRIGHLYPKVQLPKEHGGGEATVIAWLWARTVTCPNPACGARMPLVRSFALSTKKGKETWVDPVINHEARTVCFTIKSGPGVPPTPPKLGRGANFHCLVCEQAAAGAHIKREGVEGRMGAQLMAIVAEGHGGRIYLPPAADHEAIAATAEPGWVPSEPLANDPRAIWCVNYGLDTFGKLFTPRQLVALTTFSELVSEARERVQRDAATAGLRDDGVRLDAGGMSATAYADAVATYLTFSIDRLANYATTICTWHSGIKYETLTSTFGRQALPMAWDFAEGNPFSESSGNFISQVAGVASNVHQMGSVASPGDVAQKDAALPDVPASSYLVSTDPPYYDNIGYADLSDFFYIWLRRSLQSVYPALFGTMLVPKAQELIATPYRFGGSKAKAEQFFEDGLGRAFAVMRAAQHPDYPLTVYYAYKQAESKSSDGDLAGTASTGWETMLEGLITAGFTITGTWPIRSELTTNLKKQMSALASSIVLVCRPRLETAPVATRRDFLQALKRELPQALRHLQQGNIAPVDLAQASIGPGMAVFTRYDRVLEVDGSSMPVRAALQIINQALDEVVSAQDSEYDTDTRWAVAWFEQFGLNIADYGDAETLSRAKNSSVKGLQEAGILEARAGKVRLLTRKELPAEWDPAKDQRFTVWEATQHLAQALEEGANTGAALLLAKLGSRGDAARDLAYRLYLLCERKGWADEALAYNALVVAWPDIAALARTIGHAPVQGALDGLLG
jgi:putative DNA methylase